MCLGKGVFTVFCLTDKWMPWAEVCSGQMVLKGNFALVPFVASNFIQLKSSENIL